MPLNPITENLWYTKEDNKNMRMVISANTKHPIVWTLTKLENASPLGIQTLTFYQNYWNEHTDYIEKDSDGNIVGMWADYFSSEIIPTDPPTPPLFYLLLQPKSQLQLPQSKLVVVINLSL